MFKRRTQQPVHHRVGYVLWPRTGWSRAVRYLGHRVLRLHGTPYTIAAGIACGVAVSFTPLVGGHLVLAAFFAWLIGGNIIAALIGTAMGNPWTFPFIWLWTFKIGSAIGAGAGHTQVAPNFVQVFADLIKALLRFDLGAEFFHKIWAVWWPMMVGSVPTVLVVWLASYLLLRPIVATYQRQRIIRRRRKAARRAARAEKMAGKSTADKTAETVVPATVVRPELKEETGG